MTRLTFWKDDSGNSVVCQHKGAGSRGSSKGPGDKVGGELRDCGEEQGEGGSWWTLTRCGSWDGQGGRYHGSLLYLP